MTKVRFHGPIAGFSGAMGEIVFADHEKAGRTVAYMKTHHAPSEAQVDQQERFAEAVRHAKALLASPELRAFYAPIARERNITVQALAIADTLNLPSIKSLDLSSYQGQVGDIIAIRTEDDLGLAGVEVNIVSNQGAAIERGSAVEIGAGSGQWAYTATAPVALGSDIFIEVTGVDHAGTTATFTESPRVGAAN